MPVKQSLGLIGAILLIVGSFAPIVKIPIADDLTYFQCSQNKEIAIWFCGIVSLVLVLLKKYGALIFTGLFSFGMISFTFFDLQSKVRRIHAQLNQCLEGNSFNELMNYVQIEWGFALLVLGATLLVITAFLKNKTNLHCNPN